MNLIGLLLWSGYAFAALPTLEPMNTVWTFDNGGQIYILQQSELNSGNTLTLDKKTPIHTPYMGKLRLWESGKSQIADSYLYGKSSSYAMSPLTLTDDQRLDYFEKTTDRYELPVVSPDGRYVTVNKFNRLQKILAVLDQSARENVLRPLVERATSEDVFSPNGGESEYYERDISWLANAGDPRVLFVSNGQIMVGEPAGAQFSAHTAGFQHDGVPFMPQWRSRTEIIWTEKNQILVGNLESKTVKTFNRADYESIPRIDLNKADPDLVAYVARKGGSAISGILNLNEGEFNQIAGSDAVEAFNLTWSPNGYELAYVMLDSKARLRTLNLYDIRTEQSRQLSNESFTLTRDSYPAFYPDGSAVFYVGEDEYGLSRLLFSDVSQTNQSQTVSVKFGDRDVQSVMGVAFYPGRLEELNKSNQTLRIYLVAQAIARPELYEIDLKNARYNATPLSLSLPKTATNNFIGSPRAIASVEATRNAFEAQYQQAQRDFQNVLKQEAQLTVAPVAKISFPSGLNYRCGQSTLARVKAQQSQVQTDLAHRLTNEFAQFKQVGQAGLVNLDRVQRSAIRKDADLTLEKVFGEWNQMLTTPHRNRAEVDQTLSKQVRDWESELGKAVQQEQIFTNFLKQQHPNFKAWTDNFNKLTSDADRHFNKNYPKTSPVAPEFQAAYGNMQSEIQRTLATMHSLRDTGVKKIAEFPQATGCEYDRDFQVLSGDVVQKLADLQSLYNTLDSYQKAWDSFAGDMESVKRAWGKFQAYLHTGDANSDNQRLPNYKTSREQLMAMLKMARYYPDEINNLRLIVTFMNAMEQNQWPNPTDTRAVNDLKSGANLADSKGDDWIVRSRNAVIIEFFKGRYFPRGQSIDPKNGDLKDALAYIQDMEKARESDTRAFGKMLKAVDSYAASKR